MAVPNDVQQRFVTYVKPGIKVEIRKVPHYEANEMMTFSVKNVIRAYIKFINPDDETKRVYLVCFASEDKTIDKKKDKQIMTMSFRYTIHVLTEEGLTYPIRGKIGMGFIIDINSGNTSIEKLSQVLIDGALTHASDDVVSARFKEAQAEIEEQVVACAAARDAFRPRDRGSSTVANFALFDKNVEKLIRPFIVPGVLFSRVTAFEREPHPFFILRKNPKEWVCIRFWESEDSKAGYWVNIHGQPVGKASTKVAPILSYLHEHGFVVNVVTQVEGGYDIVIPHTPDMGDLIARMDAIVWGQIAEGDVEIQLCALKCRCCGKTPPSVKQSWSACAKCKKRGRRADGYYCSTACQERDWASHKLEFHTEASAVEAPVGAAVEAADGAAVGPAVVGPAAVGSAAGVGAADGAAIGAAVGVEDGSAAFTVCAYCEKHAEAGWPRCVACKAVAYCCKDCQRRDWPEHRAACRR